MEEYYKTEGSKIIKSYGKEYKMLQDSLAEYNHFIPDLEEVLKEKKTLDEMNVLISNLREMEMGCLIIL